MHWKVSSGRVYPVAYSWSLLTRGPLIQETLPYIATGLNSPLFQSVAAFATPVNDRVRCPDPWRGLLVLYQPRARESFCELQPRGTQLSLWPLCNELYWWFSLFVNCSSSNGRNTRKSMDVEQINSFRTLILNALFFNPGKSACLYIKASWTVKQVIIKCFKKMVNQFQKLL